MIVLYLANTSNNRKSMVYMLYKGIDKRCPFCLLDFGEVTFKWVEDMEYGMNASRKMLHLLMGKCGDLLATSYKCAPSHRTMNPSIS